MQIDPTIFADVTLKLTTNRDEVAHIVLCQRLNISSDGVPVTRCTNAFILPRLLQECFAKAALEDHSEASSYPNYEGASS